MGFTDPAQCPICVQYLKQDSILEALLELSDQIATAPVPGPMPDAVCSIHQSSCPLASRLEGNTILADPIIIGQRERLMLYAAGSSTDSASNGPCSGGSCPCSAASCTPPCKRVCIWPEIWFQSFCMCCIWRRPGVQHLQPLCHLHAPGNRKPFLSCDSLPSQHG